jgi:hypothetical protein
LLAPSPGNKTEKPQTMVRAGAQKPLFDTTPGNNMAFHQKKQQKTRKRAKKHMLHTR